MLLSYYQLLLVRIVMIRWNSVFMNATTRDLKGVWIIGMTLKHKRVALFHESCYCLSCGNRAETFVALQRLYRLYMWNDFKACFRIDINLTFDGYMSPLSPAAHIRVLLTSARIFLRMAKMHHDRLALFLHWWNDIRHKASLCINNLTLTLF